MITLSHKDWRSIRVQISTEYGLSMILIKEKLKRELGFSVREHRWYTEQRGTEKIICLDFYNEPAETMFRLKYL